MVQLRSGTALDAGITEVPKHERRNSDASTGSGNSSDIIEYDELETVQEKRPKQYRTTRQKVDRRAPSTFVSTFRLAHRCGQAGSSASRTKRNTLCYVDTKADWSLRTQWKKSFKEQSECTQDALTTRQPELTWDFLQPMENACATSRRARRTCTT